MATPHIEAKKGDIAPIVLMPGDPLRAKYIADTYLENVVCFNTVRNMFGYTGTYKGRKISVMGSGMGMPSIGIYSFELYSQYDVESIIRIGSCGSFKEEVKIRDVIIVQGASTDSNFASQYHINGQLAALSDYQLLYQAVEQAKALNVRYHVGNILSSDVFYHASKNADMWKQWADMGVLGVEMESFALFCNAQYLNKKALCILTVSDSLVTHEATSAQERQETFNQMMEIALNIE